MILLTLVLENNQKQVLISLGTESVVKAETVDWYVDWVDLLEHLDKK